MRPGTLRLLGAGLALASLGVLSASIYSMTQRLQGRSVPMVWFGEPALTSEFTFAGARCTVETVEVEPATEERPGRTQVAITWRGERLTLTLDATEDERFPGLLRYGSWMKIVPMAELPPGTPGGKAELERRIEAGEIQPDLVVVTRRLPEGFDPRTWGTVRRSEWSYRLIRLLPESSGPTTHRAYERSYSELQDMAELLFETLDYEEGSTLKGDPGVLAGQALEIREEFGARPGDEALWAAAERLQRASESGDRSAIDAAVRDLRTELEERFWQYQAMLDITPKLQQPRTKVVDYGISSMGWTWPAAGVSGLGLTVGALMFAMSFVRRDPI